MVSFFAIHHVSQKRRLVARWVRALLPSALDLGVRPQMAHRILADTVLVVHLGFILFVMAGAFLVRWRRGVAWAHLPAVAWGALIEFMGWRCPLTPLEIWARSRAGETGYSGGFIEHYLLPVVYPAALTPDVQLVLGALVLAVNASLYAWIVGRSVKGKVA